MSGGLSVNVDDATLLHAMRRRPVDVVREVNRALNRASHEVARAAKRNAPKAFSHLTHSIKPERIASLSYRVIAGMNYAYGIEHGTPAGSWPSRTHIQEWMKIKRITPKYGVKISSFLVARAIAEHGTAAQPYMEPALEDNRDRIMQLVREAVRRGLNHV